VTVFRHGDRWHAHIEIPPPRRYPGDLPAKAYDKWLSADQLADALEALLKPYPTKQMVEDAVVSTLVNSPKNEGPELLHSD
jgi:putative SOS response-associated peptidase YedK